MERVCKSLARRVNAVNESGVRCSWTKWLVERDCLHLLQSSSDIIAVSHANPKGEGEWRIWV